MAAIVKELKVLAQEREKIDRRAADLSAAYEALVRIHETPASQSSPPSPVLMSQKAKPKFPLRASVLEVIRLADDPLSVQEIRDALVEKGWSENHKNSLATLRAVLTRLVASGEVVIIQEEGWGKHYQDRRRRDEQRARDREQRAAERAELKARTAARSETRDLLVEPRREILRAHPNGLSAKAIAAKVERCGIDLSSFPRPASPVAMVLATLPDVRGVVERRGDDGLIRRYYYLTT